MKSVFAILAVLCSAAHGQLITTCFPQIPPSPLCSQVACTSCPEGYTNVVEQAIDCWATEPVRSEPFDGDTYFSDCWQAYQEGISGVVDEAIARMKWTCTYAPSSGQCNEQAVCYTYLGLDGNSCWTHWGSLYDKICTPSNCVENCRLTACTTTGQDPCRYVSAALRKVDHDYLFCLCLDSWLTPSAACCAMLDTNLDGGVDGSDTTTFFEDWANGEGCGDFNGDSAYDGADVEAYYDLLAAC